jgi:REP element-mobilizing transposase RayT
MRKAKIRQLEMDDYLLGQRMTSGHGGPRKGAGPKPSGKGHAPHDRRTRFSKLTPCHVTLRVVDGLPSLRQEELITEVRKSFGKSCDRGDFRLIEYSVHDHLHMIVEADSKAALSKGMMAIGARFAKAVNRVLERVGKVIAERYHARLLGTPTEVRNALHYVLLNSRKHYKQRFGTPPPVRIDVCSSGPQFDGWRRCSESSRIETSTREEMGVAKAICWLLTVGWRRMGLISPSAVPSS